MKIWKRLNQVVTIVTAVVLAWLCYVALQPGGAVGSAYASWRTRTRQRQLIDREWTSLVEGGNRMDAGTGPVLIIEFADYQCPYCRLGEPILDTLMREHPEIGIAYRNFPLDVHPQAEGAARAALCAAQQGRFSQMHDLLLRSDGWQRDANWVREARTAGVPELSQFHQCLRSASTNERLNQDVAWAKRLGIQGTPTFVTKRGYQTGVPSLETLVASARP